VGDNCKGASGVDRLLQFGLQLVAHKWL
jgi:hypothetical protein